MDDRLRPRFAMVIRSAILRSVGESVFAGHPAANMHVVQKSHRQRGLHDT